MWLDLVVGVVGVVVTILVVVGMFLITPRGLEKPRPAAEPPGVADAAPPTPTASQAALR
jgi:hypothetical protein